MLVLPRLRSAHQIGLAACAIALSAFCANAQAQPLSLPNLGSAAQASAESNSPSIPGQPVDAPAAPSSAAQPAPSAEPQAPASDLSQSSTDATTSTDTLQSASTYPSLRTASYTLDIAYHCPEGEVGCSYISGTLTNKTNGQIHRLRGRAVMVPCKDGQTPCHLSYYQLSKVAKASVVEYINQSEEPQPVELRAYPDGRIEFSKPAWPAEQGQWQ